MSGTGLAHNTSNKTAPRGQSDTNVTKIGTGVSSNETPPTEGRSLILTPQRGPIESVVFTFAMVQEACRWVQDLGLQPFESAKNPGLHEQYRGKIGAVDVVVSINQFSLRHGVPGRGTTNSALNAFCAINEFKPSVLVNAGTAGGFSRSGGVVGDIYLTRGAVMYHDRRIPIGEFEPYGNGSFSCLTLQHIPKVLSAKTGVFSTGNSLDYQDADMKRMTTSGASVKDMEAAAFAEVAESFKVPFIGIKSISDLVDGRHSTIEQFRDNFGLATKNLQSALNRFVQFLSEGRRLEDL